MQQKLTDDNHAAPVPVPPDPLTHDVYNPFEPHRVQCRVDLVNDGKKKSGAAETTAKKPKLGPNKDG